MLHCGMSSQTQQSGSSSHSGLCVGALGLKPADLDAGDGKCVVDRCCMMIKAGPFLSLLYREGCCGSLHVSEVIYGSKGQGVNSSLL